MPERRVVSLATPPALRDRLDELAGRAGVKRSVLWIALTGAALEGDTLGKRLVEGNADADQIYRLAKQYGYRGPGRPRRGSDNSKDGGDSNGRSN